MTEKPIKYAKTDKEAAELIGIDPATFWNWKGSADFNVKKTVAGWPMAALYDYQAKRKTRDKRNTTGEQGDLKRRKLEVEIDILVAKRDEIRGELLPLQEHVEDMQWLASIVTSALDEFVQFTTAGFRDAKATAEAERIRDKVRARIKGEIDNAKK
jgi:hypothetical protein